ncbi:hypothetical protein L7F22_045177 [Adiantum nelumboides]|nr:hypothetical protein [Adiantum nelumboides]
MLGQAGCGKLRVSMGQTKLAAKAAKKFKEKSYGSSGATRGLTSSLAFTPVHRIELTNLQTHAALSEDTNVRFYGLPNQTWKICVLEESSELSQPPLGVVMAHKLEMYRIERCSFVALHSEAWLISLAFFFTAQFEEKNRKFVFETIIKLSSIIQAVKAGSESLVNLLSSLNPCSSVNPAHRKKSEIVNSSPVSRLASSTVLNAVLIAGYAQQGQGQEAVRYFQRMQS